MGVVEPQFGRVFDREDALAVGDEVGQHVEQGGFARTSAAGDDDVLAFMDAQLQEGHHGRAE